MAISPVAASERATLPSAGTSWPALRQRLGDAKGGDYGWQAGELPLYVYWLDDQLGHVAQEASSLYFMENGLGRTAFPSVQWLQQEVIDIGLSLFHAPVAAAGSFTSGGT